MYTLSLCLMHFELNVWIHSSKHKYLRNVLFCYLEYNVIVGILQGDAMTFFFYRFSSKSRLLFDFIHNNDKNQ